MFKSLGHVIQMKPLVRTILFGALLGPIGISSLASAATLRVPDEFASIAEAYEVARAGDTILVSSGEYPGPVRLHGVEDIALVGLRGATIDAGPRDAGISVLRSSRIRIQGFVVEGGATGIAILKSQDVSVANVLVKESRGSGVSVLKGKVVAIESSSVEGAFLDGVRLRRCRDCRLEGVSVQASRSGGINDKRSRNLIVRGCEVAGSGREGIASQSSKGGLLERSVASGNERNGIRMRRARRWMVEGNEARANGRYGFFVDKSRPIRSADQLTQTGNVAEGNERGGFEVR